MLKRRVNLCDGEGGFLTCDEAKLDGEFGRYLCDNVAAQIARLQLGMSHQMVNGIGHLDQLAFREICKKVENEKGNR